MPNITRHIGRLKSTGSRVALIWLQLPDAPQKCLAAQLDTIPDYFKDILGRIIDSDEGQQAVELNTVLNRIKAEGENVSILEALHKNGCLTAFPIENVEMLPLPSQAVPLTTILKGMGRIVPHGVMETQHEYANPRKMTKFEENQQADLDKNRMQIAQNKLNHAAILEQEARQYRAEAYEIAPHLNPNQPEAEEATPVAEAEAVEPAPTDEGHTMDAAIANVYADNESLDIFGEQDRPVADD